LISFGTAVSIPRMYSVVLFDFDYTLADSTPAIIDCANTALCELGYAPATEAAIRRTIGMSLPDTFSALTHSQGHELRAAFSKLFTRRADDVMVNQTTIYSETCEVMEAIRNRGIKTGIVTTKFQRRIHAILHREKMETLFDVVVGAENVKTHKPSPEGLLLALAQLQIPPANALYVGDSLIDAESADHAGVDFAAVTTGVTAAIEFNGYPTVAVLGRLAEVLDLLRGR
jgi:phosphoglycolate phosphatase